MQNNLQLFLKCSSVFCIQVIYKVNPIYLKCLMMSFYEVLLLLLLRALLPVCHVKSNQLFAIQFNKDSLNFKQSTMGIVSYAVKFEMNYKGWYLAFYFKNIFILYTSKFHLCLLPSSVQHFIQADFFNIQLPFQK